MHHIIQKEDITDTIAANGLTQNEIGSLCTMEYHYFAIKGYSSEVS